MKPKIKQVIALVCGIGLLSNCVYAATLIEYDTPSRTLQIQGEFADSVDGVVTFSILPAGVNPQDVNAETANTADMLYRTISIQDDGSLSSTIVLPESFKNGQYVLRTYQDSLCFTNYFGFLGTPVSQSTLQMINASTNAEETLSALKSISAMGFENSSLSKYGSIIAEYVFKNRPDAGYTDSLLMESYFMGEALGRLAAREIELDELLTAYSAYVDIDYKTEFASLPTEIQEEMISLFAKMESLKGDFRVLFQNTRELARMKCAVSFSSLQKTYLSYAAEHNISLDAYYGLSSSYQQDQVFIKLFARIRNAENMEEVHTMFRAAVDEAKNDTENNSHGGGNGGGGGGGNSTTYLPADSTPLPDTNVIPQESFSDIAQHWAKGYIEQMKQLGAINGFEDGTFRPDQVVTRAEFVKMLGELLQLPQREGTVFDDVARSDWYYTAVYAAYEQDLIRGTSEHEFSPEAEITREDAAVIIQRAWSVSGGSAKDFADSSDVSAYAVEAVRTLSAAGILTGYADDTIAPKASLTRAETAALLARVLDVVNG